MQYSNCTNVRVRVEDRTRVLAAGYDTFVPKPVEPEELIVTLSNLVRGSRERKLRSSPVAAGIQVLLL